MYPGVVNNSSVINNSNVVNNSNVGNNSNVVNNLSVINNSNNTIVVNCNFTQGNLPPLKSILFNFFESTLARSAPSESLTRGRVEKRKSPEVENAKKQPTKRIKKVPANEAALNKLYKIQEKIDAFLTKLGDTSDMPNEKLVSAGIKIDKYKDEIHSQNLLMGDNAESRISKIKIILEIVNPYPYSPKLFEREKILFNKINILINNLLTSPKYSASVKAEAERLHRLYCFEKLPELGYNHAVGMSEQISNQIECLKSEIKEVKENSNDPHRIQGLWRQIFELSKSEVNRFNSTLDYYGSIEKSNNSVAIENALALSFENLGDFYKESFEDFPKKELSYLNLSMINYKKSISKYCDVINFYKSNGEDYTEIGYKIDYLEYMIENINSKIAEQKGKESQDAPQSKEVEDSSNVIEATSNVIEENGEIEEKNAQDQIAPSISRTNSHKNIVESSSSEAFTSSTESMDESYSSSDDFIVNMMISQLS